MYLQIYFLHALPLAIQTNMDVLPRTVIRDSYEYRAFFSHALPFEALINIGGFHALPLETLTPI